MRSRSVSTPSVVALPWQIAITSPTHAPHCHRHLNCGLFLSCTFFHDFNHEASRHCNNGKCVSMTTSNTLSIYVCEITPYRPGGMVVNAESLIRQLQKDNSSCRYSTSFVQIYLVSPALISEKKTLQPSFTTAQRALTLRCVLILETDG